jgi:signal transduction histidine kinase
MKTMLAELPRDKEGPALITSVPATAQHRRVAISVVLLFLCIFATAMPFATIKVARVDAFLPATQAIVLFADLITAVFLFAQFSIQPQRALLALASGYMLSGLFAFLQTLDFPGAYSQSGLISGTPSGAVWLFSFWRIMFPIAVVAYVLTKDVHESGRVAEHAPRRIIAAAVTCVLAVAAGLSWLVSAGYLPNLYIDATRQTLAVQYFAGAMWLLNAAAIVLLFIRQRTILDVWLIVAVFVAIPDLGLAFFFPAVRFSIGWYMAKSYIVIASCTVLIVLLWETTLLYARLAAAQILQRRERVNRLMSVEAATAAIAHEINQPITAIVLNSTVALSSLKKRPPDLQEVQECVQATLDSGSRAGDIVTSIRRLFRTSMSPRKHINLNRLTQQVLSMVEPDLQRNYVTVSTDLQRNLPQVLADDVQLQQVVINLVKNAIEAMAAAASPERTLRLTTAQESRTIVSLLIEDTGPGIDPESARKIFEPFFTTKSSGMGLGLPLCKSIVEEHGGELLLDKADPSGCVFRITLPIALGSPPEPVMAQFLQAPH